MLQQPIESSPTGSRSRTIHEAIPQLFTMPLFLAMLICYSLSLLANLITLVKQTPLDAVATMLGSSGSLLAQVSGTIRTASFLLQLPGIIMVAALWLVFWTAKTNSDDRGYRIGFTIVQLVQFLRFLLALVFIPLILFKGNQLMEALHLTDSSTTTVLVVSGIVSICFLFRLMLSFWFIKETVCEKTIITQVSIFVPVLCFILSATALLLALKAQAGIETFLPSVSAILFGLYLLKYRSEMVHLSSE